MKAVLATCSADRKYNVIRVGKKSFLYRLIQALFLLMVLVIIALLGLANLVFLENVVAVWKKVTGQQEL
ncbi:hypothetical protein EON65_37265 [archaeon]|nr:MAG: hypothetical protein EON65_37265 [archaeon]